MTRVQRDVLHALDKGAPISLTHTPNEGWSVTVQLGLLRCNTPTMVALWERGWICSSGPHELVGPEFGGNWTITDAGRAALAEAGR